jgi:hypothetical protein
MVIYVDGKEVHRIRRDFSRVNQPVTIFTMGGSTVKVHSVSVVK